MLRNEVGGRRLSDFRETSATKMYGSMLLELRGGGCRISRKKSCARKLCARLDWTMTCDVLVGLMF